MTTRNCTRCIRPQRINILGMLGVGYCQAYSNKDHMQLTPRPKLCSVWSWEIQFSQIDKLLHNSLHRRLNLSCYLNCANSFKLFSENSYLYIVKTQFLTTRCVFARMVPWHVNSLDPIQCSYTWHLLDQSIWFFINWISDTTNLNYV